jgi:hypothetical protein
LQYCILWIIRSNKELSYVTSTCIISDQTFYCLLFNILTVKPPYKTMDSSKFIAGQVHYTNLVVTGLTFFCRERKKAIIILYIHNKTGYLLEV